MTGLAGTGQLSRLAFRRDCVVLPACVFGIAALLAITARDLKVLYPTAAAANVAIALLTCLWLTVLKLPPAGSAALALSISGCGLVFGGVAAVAAQLAVTARGARGIAIAALGAAFVLRAVGDTSPARG